jgi:hypothetical protein
MRIAALALGLVLAAGCAPKFATRQFDPIEAVSPAGGEWVYDIDEDGRDDFWEVDRDGDGTVDLYQFDTNDDGAPDYMTSREGMSVENDRTFIFFVDGVPDRQLKAMWDEGYFREFFPPSAMVSPFPSMTYLSFSQMLGTPAPPGYEELYFDRARNELKGGLGAHLGFDEEYNVKKNESFLTVFGYKQPSLYSGLIYFTTHSTARQDLKHAMHHFDSNGANLAIAYMGTTDGVAHKLGEAGIRDILVEIDRLLREFIFAHRGHLRIVFGSDHGNNYTPCRRIDLEPLLKARGFQLADRITDSTSVVIPAYGLVGFAAAYLDSTRATAFAESALSIPGVDLAAYAVAGEAHVLGAGSRGRARITHDATANRYRYLTEEGDPLELGPIVAALEAEGLVDARGSIADADWFERTASHRYPDAIRRVFEGTTNHVENTATVILSFDDTHFYGSKFFDFVVNLAGTHGNLGAPSTLGFVMCNYDRPPAYIRAPEMRSCLELPAPQPAAEPATVP